MTTVTAGTAPMQLADLSGPDRRTEGRAIAADGGWRLTVHQREASDALR